MISRLRCRSEAPPRTRRALLPMRRTLLARGFACAFAAPLIWSTAAAPAAAQPVRLQKPRSLRALLDETAGDGRPIVAMFSLPGCAWCEAIRREQLAGLARDQAKRGIKVVEFDMLDEQAFDDPRGQQSPRAATGAFARAGSAAELAKALGVRIAPTLVFLGPSGEIAQRLVGYGSPDFFSAYLDDRIDRARAALERERGKTQG